MPSKSKHQAAFFEELYNNPHLAKQHGIDYKLVKEWVEADRAKGVKHLPEKIKPKKKK